MRVAKDVNRLRRDFNCSKFTHFPKRENSISNLTCMKGNSNGMKQKCFCPCISLKSFENVGRKRNRLIMKHLHEKETEVNVKYFVSEKSAIDNGNSSTSWALPTCRYARAIKQETHHYFLVIF